MNNRERQNTDSKNALFPEDGERPRPFASYFNAWEANMPNNPVIYWELASHDAPQTVEFLKKVFDWDFEYDARTTIHELPAELTPVQGGGVFTLRRAKLPFLTIYIKVDDLDAKVKLIEENGGFIVDPPLTLPGGSRICLFNEPSGVTLAMIQSAKK